MFLHVLACLAYACDARRLQPTTKQWQVHAHDNRRKSQKSVVGGARNLAAAFNPACEAACSSRSLPTLIPRWNRLHGRLPAMSTITLPGSSPPPRRQGVHSLPGLDEKREATELECRLCMEGQLKDVPTFHLGLGTFRVPLAMHSANRVRLAERMPADASGVVLLQGGEQPTRYDTDHEPVFRQESYFQYLFGVSDAGCLGAVTLPDARATLFVPKLGEDYEVFCGRYPPAEDFRERYGVEDVRYLDELPAWLDAELGKSGDQKLYLLSGLNTDSGNYAMPAKFAGDEAFESQRDTTTLFGALAEARVTKSAAEVELMRYVNWVSSMAHVEVMRAARPGMMEYQLESLFQHHTYTHGGCRHMSYTCICACGPNPAILHYGHSGRPNNRQIANGDMALLDMGAEYHCYASDITCSFPITDVVPGQSRFTPDQKMVYEAVLSAQRAVIMALRPGVMWQEMHRTAERAILQALLEGGVLTTAGLSEDGAIEAMLEVDLGAVFMPHGLGHLIGIDTHDVGGYLPGTTPRSTRPGLSKLRTARRIEEGMVLTVEPGLYFIDILLNRALADLKQAAFLVPERIEQLRGTGGVRLEDDVVVTATGVDNLTLCPRTIAEVEAVLDGGKWPPARDEAPELRRQWCGPNSAVIGGVMEPLSLASAEHAMA